MSMNDAENRAALAGAELERRHQYLSLWRLNVRLEIVMLGMLGCLALAIAVAFVMLDLGEDDITGTWGYPALWLISLLRASSVLIPIPGGGLTIAAGAAMDPVWGIPAPIMVGVAAGSAESIGEFTGYLAGVNSGRLMEERKFYRTVRGWIQRRAFTTMLLMSLAPSPVFDVAGLAAGAARVPIRVFYPAILIGKVGRGIAMGFVGFYGIEVLGRFL